MKEQILDCLKTLKSCEFNVRVIVSNNHSTNVSAYDMLLRESGQELNSSFMIYESRKIYLLYDPVHLMKNLQNNLLNYKRFIFPPFQFDEFDDKIDVQAGEMSWKTLHDTHEKDETRK